MVPNPDMSIGTARAVALALGENLVAPELPELYTFDQSHLDLKSAQRWSKAFITAAGPQIRDCLNVSQNLSSESHPLKNTSD